MTEEEILKIYPEISKIGNQDYNEILSNKFSLKFHPEQTWQEMGLDDLDLIEMIMELEKVFNFAISDYHIEEFFNLNHKPIDFRQYNRNKIIEKIINDN